MFYNNKPGSLIRDIGNGDDDEVFGGYEDNERQQSGYEKLLIHSLNPRLTNSRSPHSLPCVAVICQALLSSTRFKFLLFIVTTALILTLIYSSWSFTEWNSAVEITKLSPTHNNSLFFPQFSNVSLTPQDAEDARNVENIVRGERTCRPVLDELGRPTGNYSYVQTKVDSDHKKEFVRHRHPFIVHYIRIVDYGVNDDGGVFNYAYPNSIIDYSWQLGRIQYLSIRSAWKALLEAKNFDAESGAELENQTEPVIYLHSNVEPTGFYYNLLQKRNTSPSDPKNNVNLKWNYIPRTSTIGGHEVERIEHEADFQKVNVTYTFGGVHMDFDVLLVNGTRLRELQDSAECFITVDVNLRSNGKLSRENRHDFNWMLNAGLFGCQKESEFLRIWLNNYMCDFRAGDYLFNSGLFPRLLFEYYRKSAPGAIALDWQSCMLWRFELLKEEEELGGSQLSQNEWLKFAGLHFYHVEHVKFLWQVMLRKSSSIFAQAARLAQFDSTEPQLSPTIDWD